MKGIIIHMNNTTSTITVLNSDAICNCNTCIWKDDCGNNTWMIESGIYDERFYCTDYTPVLGEIDIEQDYETNARERECYYQNLVRQFN